MFFDNSGNVVASSNPILVYFHWFLSNSASDTTRSYNAPANNAKYSVSKKLVPYVFSTNSVLSTQVNVSNCLKTIGVHCIFEMHKDI